MDDAMNKIIRISIFFTVLLLASSPASASDFQVSPITLELGQGVNSGVFTVINEGEGKINFQISLSEWTQDDTGKDVYSESTDIIFFPKIMTLETDEQRVIRVGLKGTRVQEEKTYRLFIEQIPSREKGVGVNIAVSIRFAPPIFVKPAQIKTSGAIETIMLTKGKISAVVRNTGNVHFKITSILIKGRSASGAEVFSKEIAGWYLLNHVVRNIETSFSQEKCKELSTIEIEAKTEKFNLNGKLDVQRGMCSQ
jgi:fimbrial chaperone protein